MGKLRHGFERFKKKSGHLSISPRPFEWWAVQFGNPLRSLMYGQAHVRHIAHQLRGDQVDEKG